MYIFIKAITGSIRKMPDPRILVLLFSCALLVTCESSSIGYGNSDGSYSYSDDCNTVCLKLVDCEEDWLEDEHDSPMTIEERHDYRQECEDDCEENGEDSDRECLDNASCSEILDGKCSS
jgi:hypothetical protein